MGTRLWRVAACAAATLLSAGMVGAVAAAPAGSAPSEKPAAATLRGASSAPGPVWTVTLITGDRVFLDRDGKVVSVRPAKGREDISVSTRTLGDRTMVLPADAALLVARGELDERLFDVTKLVEFGYDDARRDDLPVIVTGSRQGSKALAAARGADGAEVARELASVNGAAVEVDRDAGSSFWDSITEGDDDGEPRTLGTGIAKVWLDGKVEASLDESVPQIGAPEAWEAGFDGEGVTVAVLDTGIDDTHPDLKGRVAAAENFSEAEDTLDRFGHGTHVASIAAGNGERYRGVAPGARLLNGKVLDDDGFGTESTVIAGMQWAVEQSARVVNLSLGADDMPGLDPVEEAIETLTAESGALFVVAAGNYGPEAHTVDSPAAAPSALAVGAVDKGDGIAEFSARGTTADGALKPDLTAPGVEITAARATGTDGEGSHVTHDGTSMATPHVAGAAAILAQQHPDWDGAQIRAVLTASAQPGELSAYAQGSGRVDLSRAITQTVTAEPGGVDFGIHEYPHEQDPVSQELTYHNAGDEPVELDLALNAYGPEGSPAPEGMFSLDPATITVPAGGKAGVTVTADTSMDSPHGVFGGTITATNDETGTSVSTAVGVWKQGPMYDLRLTFLDANGEPATDAYADVFGLESDYWEFVFPDDDGRATLRVPEGVYHLNGDVWSEADEHASTLVKPKFEVTEDTEIVLDARLAEPFDITMPDSDVTPVGSEYNYTVSSEYVSLTYVAWNFDAGPNDFRIADLGPSLPDDELNAMVAGAWKSGGRSPDWYHAGWTGTGTLLAGLSEAPASEDFADIDTTVGLSSEQGGGRFLSGWADAMSGFTTFSTPTDLPMSGVNHVLGGDDILWSFGGAQWSADPEVEWADTWVQSAPREYTAGETGEETYNVGVFGPSLTGDPSEWFFAPGLFRFDDEYWAYLPAFVDGADHPGYSRYGEAHSSLRLNGEEIFAADAPLFDDDFPVSLGTGPSEGGRFELSTEVTRSAEISAVSSRIQATWTGEVGAASEEEVQEFPLSVVRFSPDLSPRSTAPAGRSMRVPFSVQGAAESNVDELSIEVSYDDGGTWKPVKMLRGDRFEVKHPKKPGSVSLRVDLTDKDGNTLEQTIHRAYLTVPAEPEPTETPEPTESPEPTTSPEPTEPPDTKTPATVPPGDEPPLPNTGTGSAGWLVSGALLLALGGALTAATARRT